MTGTSRWLFLDAPTMLAALDAQLVCRHASRGWREHLGLAGNHELEVPLADLFSLDEKSSLPGQLKDLLHDGTSRHQIAVSLTGKRQSLRYIHQILLLAFTGVKM